MSTSTSISPIRNVRLGSSSMPTGRTGTDAACLRLPRFIVPADAAPELLPPAPRVVPASDVNIRACTSGPDLLVAAAAPALPERLDTPSIIESRCRGVAMRPSTLAASGGSWGRACVAHPASKQDRLGRPRRTPSLSSQRADRPARRRCWRGTPAPLRSNSSSRRSFGSAKQMLTARRTTWLPRRCADRTESSARLSSQTSPEASTSSSQPAIFRTGDTAQPSRSTNLR